MNSRALENGGKAVNLTKCVTNVVILLRYHTKGLVKAINAYSPGFTLSENNRKLTLHRYNPSSTLLNPP